MDRKSERNKNIKIKRRVTEVNNVENYYIHIILNLLNKINASK